MTEVTMYGAEWCSDCRRSKALLNAESVQFDYKDLEVDPGFANEAEAISGRKNIPVIRFADGFVMVEPTDADLREALEERGLIK